MPAHEPPCPNSSALLSRCNQVTNGKGSSSFWHFWIFLEKLKFLLRHRLGVYRHSGQSRQRSSVFSTSWCFRPENRKKRVRDAAPRMRSPLSSFNCRSGRIPFSVVQVFFFLAWGREAVRQEASFSILLCLVGCYPGHHQQGLVHSPLSQAGLHAHALVGSLSQWQANHCGTGKQWEVWALRDQLLCRGGSPSLSRGPYLTSRDGDWLSISTCR